MPSSRPCAAFEPISPDFDLHDLVESTPNFQWVVRIHCDMIEHQGLENFEKLVLIHVILGGRPLIIEGYLERLDRWTFALQWLRDNLASKVDMARDLTKKTNIPLSIGHYLNHMALLTNQWNEKNYKDPKRQRMYLKDIDCPQLWHDKLHDLVPLGLFYLNESTGDIGGFGAVDEADPNGPGTRKGRGVAKAGDLMSSLPKEMRAENLMCYIGHEGTYTPAHREMCASLGQNIMVETSTGAVEDGKPTKPGSSIWFMTESKEREVVSEYWLSRLGHDIEVENHFAQINAWKAAPFKTYVVEQRVGDFILIPPLAPHQVWNRGTRTMKVAWNRTTVETLEMAYNEALPRARMVCRDEQYKNKAIVFFTLQKYSKAVKSIAKQRQKTHGAKHREFNDTKVRQLEKDFRRLQAIYTSILVSESFFSQHVEKKVELIPFDSNITCSYCRCNIFNRFLTCPSCIGELGEGEEDTYDICMECYAMGRSCACISKLKWVEQFPWGELVQKHEQWRHQILQTEGQVTEKTPKSLKIELDRLGKRRTLAQICQLELAKRPFRDVSKPAPLPEGLEREEEVEVDAHGNMKRKRKVKRSEKFLREHAPCHVDIHWEPKWKQAQCITCDKSFCYGVLFRAYDMMPQDIMADPAWKCPSCQNICSCRHCRIKPGYKPFTPSGTMLGHNTKAVADPRSVESLVDFSFSNISWIQKAGDDHKDDTKRLTKRKKAAEEAQAKDPELGDHYVEQETNDVGDDIESNILRLAQQEGIPIDPALANIGLPSGGDHESPDTEDDLDENPEEARQANYLRGSPLAPQYVVPDGGVIRDAEHAYDMTEAITYDYPDPEMSLHLSLPDEETGKGPRGAYGPVTPSSPREIEMIDRKRKRAKADEGDKSYNYKKPALNKPNLRKSLIVRLAIRKEKLVSMNKMAIIAQRALNGVNEPTAPVISSDLRALNSTWNGSEGASQPKKGRVDQLPVDEDDDFTPSRKRDRRKSALDTSPRPIPDSDVTRRTTRMQGLTYEDPYNEEELSEILPGRPARSKLAVMERLNLNSGSEDKSGTQGAEAESDTAESSNSNNISMPGSHVSNTAPNMPSNRAMALDLLPAKDTDPLSSSVDNANESVRSQPAPLQPYTAAKESESAPKTSHEIKLPASLKQQGSRISVTQKVAKPSPNTLAEAQANQKAKMAAVEWAERDSDSFDTDKWPGEESDSSIPTEVLEKSDRVVKDQNSMPSAIRTMPKTSPPPVKVVRVSKASAKDWRDSESSGDDSVRSHKGATKFRIASRASVKKPRTSGLVPVNTRRGRDRGRGRSSLG